METPVTIEQMILEGSCTAAWASKAGYTWGAQVVGGDALSRRTRWLALQASSTTFTGS